MGEFRKPTLFAPAIGAPLVAGALAALLAAGTGELSAQPPVAPGGGDLPPIACVGAVRTARLAEERGDLAAARQALEAAVDLPACELPALASLLHLLRDGALDAARVAVLSERLAALLSDPATELPRGLLTQLAKLEVADSASQTTQTDQLLVGALQRRVAAAALPAVAGGEARSLPQPELAEVLEVSADLEERLGRPEEARATLERLLSVAPTDALRWRAMLFDLGHGRWQSAADLLAPLVREPQANDALRTYYVTALAHLGRYDEMLVELAALAPPPPAPPTAGVAEPAAQAAERAMLLPGGFGLQPIGFATLLTNSAWALRDAGRDAEAAALFRRALTYAPDDLEARSVLLHLYGTVEERAAAAEANAARRQEESDPLALFEEGSDLLGAGDAAGARDLLARAAPALGGSDYAEPAWYNLGTAAFKLERWEEAAGAFGEALAINPQRGEGHYKQGLALHKLGRWREALAAFSRTLELLPDKKDAHYYLASCHSQLGDAAAAARESALFNQKP